MQTIKKGIVVSVSVMTALWSVGVAAFAPLAAAAAPSAAAVSAGDLVKASLPAVYYVGSDAKRYVFPNQKTYDTWYENFDSVKTITDTELAAIQIGGNATFRPSARLAKITTDPKVYMVGAGGTLTAISGEATAMALFGSDWASKVNDVPDAFFTNYSVRSESVETAATTMLPAGTIGMDSDGMLFVASTDGAHPLSDGPAAGGTMSGAWADLGGDVDMYMGSAQDGVSWNDGLTNPMRGGMLEGSFNTPVDVSPGSLMVTVDPITSDLITEAAGSMQLGSAGVMLDNSGPAVQFNSATVDFRRGAGSPEDLTSFFQCEAPSGQIYKLTASGTFGNDSRQEYSPDGGQATIETGVTNCWWMIGAQISTQITADLVEINAGGSASAEAVIDLDEELIDADVNSSSNISDVTYTSFVGPGNGIVIDGTELVVLRWTQAVSDNGIEQPAVSIRNSNSGSMQDCYFQRDGVVIADKSSTVNAGNYLVGLVDPSMWGMEERSYTMELVCIPVENNTNISLRHSESNPFNQNFDATRAPQGSSATGSQLSAEPGLRRVVRSANTITSETVTFSTALGTTVLRNVNLQDGGADNDKTIGATQSDLAYAELRNFGEAGNLSSLKVGFGSSPLPTIPTLVNTRVEIAQLDGPVATEAAAFDADNLNWSSFGANFTMTGTAITNGDPAIAATEALAAAQVVTGNYRVSAGNYYLIRVKGDHTGAGSMAGQVGAISIFPTDADNLQYDGVSGSTKVPSGAVTAQTLNSFSLAITPTMGGATAQGVSNQDNLTVGIITFPGLPTEDLFLTNLNLTVAGGTGADELADACISIRLAVDTAAAAVREISSSKNVPTGGGAITFSIPNETIAKDGQLRVMVQCQVTTVTGALAITGPNNFTMTSVSVTSEESGSTTNTAGLPFGPAVAISVNGLSTAAANNIGNPRTVTAGEQVKAASARVSNGVPEAAYLDSIALGFAKDGGAQGAFSFLNDLTTYTVTLEGFTNAAGQAVGSAFGADETVICDQRSVDGATSTCTTDGWMLDKNQAGSINVYVTGANAADQTTVTVATDFGKATLTTITMKGAESGVNFAAGGGAVAGIGLTPLDQVVEVIAGSVPAVQPGDANIAAFNGELFSYGGSGLQITLLNFSCVASDVTKECATTDTATLKHKGTNVGGAVGIALASANNIDFTPTAPVPLSGGSNQIEVIFTNATAGALGPDSSLRVGLDQIAFTTNNGESFFVGSSALLPGLFDAAGNIAYSNGIFRN